MKLHFARFLFGRSIHSIFLTAQRANQRVVVISDGLDDGFMVGRPFIILSCHQRLENFKEDGIRFFQSGEELVICVLHGYVVAVSIALSRKARPSSDSSSFGRMISASVRTPDLLCIRVSKVSNGLPVSFGLSSGRSFARPTSS